MSNDIRITTHVHDGRTNGELVMRTDGKMIIFIIGPGRIVLDNADDLRVFRGAIDAAIAIVEAHNEAARRTR